MAYVKGQFDVTQNVDANGDPATSYILKFFVWNTSTPTAVYSDSSGTSAGTEITLNSLGQPQSSGGTAIDLFFDDAVTYKAQLYQSDGTTTVGPVIGPYNVIPGGASGNADKSYASIAALIASSGNSSYSTLYIESYYAVTYPSTEGPKGSQMVHRTGGTNSSPTVGTAVSVSTIGTGTQAGYYWDADGAEWEISDKNQEITDFMFGAVADGSTDDSGAINNLIEYIKPVGGQRQGILSGSTYGVASTIIMQTGTSLIGRGRQGTKIQGLAGLGTDPVIAVSDLTGATDYFRIGLHDLWVDIGASSAAIGVDFSGLRNGDFREVYLNGFTTGFRLTAESYYNRFDHCEANGSTGRGFLLYPANNDGPNENHFYSCRCNGGVDGFVVQSDGTATINSNKFVNCVVEAHSGDAFKTVPGTNVSGTHDGSNNASVLTDSGASWTNNQFSGWILVNTTDGSKGQITSNTSTTITATLSGGTDNDWDTSDAYQVWAPIRNTQFRGSRTDTTTGGADSIVINEHSIDTVVDSDYTSGSDPVENNGDNTTFLGPKYFKTFSETIDFPSVSANSQQAVTFTLSGINASEWVVDANPLGGGAFSDGLILEARVSTSNTVKLIAHNKTGGALDPASQVFIGVARRVL